MTPNFSEALDAASLASLAYDKPNIKHAEAQGLIRIQNGVQQVAIAGTNDPSDIWDDVNVDIVHRGYGGWVFKGTADYSDLFLTALRPLLKKELSIVLRGHSLGGAAANDIAMHLHFEGYTVSRVHTFGAPPSGMESFAKAFLDSKIECWRFEHVRDIIPRINHIPGAEKVGTGMWIDDDKWYPSDPGENIIFRAEELLGFPHHKISGYISDINKIIERT